MMKEPTDKLGKGLGDEYRTGAQMEPNYKIYYKKVIEVTIFQPREHEHSISHYLNNQLTNFGKFSNDINLWNITLKPNEPK
jgi:hypothetical protein